MRGQRQPRLADLAVRQDGVASYSQLLSLGLGPDAVQHGVRTGRLHRLHRGVYASGRADVPVRGRFLAAVLAMEGSVLSHRSAAALWGFMPEEEGPIEVTVMRKGRSRPGITSHATASLPARDIQRRAGIPVTEPHRTLLDLADVLTRRELRRALGEAEILRLVAHSRLRDHVANAHGRHGAPTLASLLARGPAPTRSPLEDDLADYLHRHDLGPRRHNARIEGYEVDVLFPERRLVIEADSRTYHDTPTTRANDAEKERELKAAGYGVLRVRQEDLADDGTAERIRSLLPSGPNRPGRGEAERLSPAQRGARRCAVAGAPRARRVVTRTRRPPARRMARRPAAVVSSGKLTPSRATPRPRTRATLVRVPVATLRGTVTRSPRSLFPPSAPRRAITRSLGWRAVPRSVAVTSGGSPAVTKLRPSSRHRRRAPTPIWGRTGGLRSTTPAPRVACRTPGPAAMTNEVRSSLEPNPWLSTAPVWRFCWPWSVVTMIVQCSSP